MTKSSMAWLATVALGFALGMMGSGPCVAAEDNTGLGIQSATPPRPHPPDEYVVPNWADLLRTMVRFHAIDLDDPNVMDGFSAVTECDLHKLFYRDDFRWNEVKKTMRASIEMHMEDFPVHYQYSSTVTLGHYDFNTKTFLLSDQTALHKINVFKIFEIYDPRDTECGDYKAENIPSIVKVRSDVPLTIVGIPLQPADAESLLRQMDNDTNSARTLFVTYKFTVTYIDKEKKKSTAVNTREQKTIYYQIREGDPRLILFDVRIDMVNFYEDKEKTKLIYSYNPYPPS